MRMFRAGLLRGVGIPLCIGLAILCAEGRSRRSQPPTPATTTGFIYAVAFSPDGQLGAVALRDTLVLVETESWKVKWRMTISSGGGAVLAFSQDGRHLALCNPSFRSRSPIGEPTDFFARAVILDAESGNVIHDSAGNGAGAVASAFFAADGSLIVVAMGADRRLFLWNALSGRFTPIATKEPVTGLSAAFTPGGDKLALAIAEARGVNEFDIRLYDTAAASLAGSLAKGSSRSAMHLLAISPDGGMLAYSTQDWAIATQNRPQLRLVDLKTRKTVRKIKNLDFTPESIVFSEDCKSIVATGSIQYVGSIRAAFPTSRTCVWDVLTGKLVKSVSVEIPPNQPRSRVLRAAVVPNHGLLCMVGSNGTAVLMEPRTAEVKGVLSAVVLAGPAGDSKGTPGTRNQQRTTPGMVLTVHRFLAMCFPSVSRVTAGSSDGKLYAWDLKMTIAPSRVDMGAPADIMAMSPDGKTAACSVDREGDVTIIDTTSGKILRSLQHLAAGVTSLVFSSSGVYLACGSADGAVRIWDTRIWKEQPAASGHTGAVRALAFSKDSTALATGSDDLTIRLWYIDSSQPPRSFKGHKQKINSLVFSPDGGTLASGADDGTVILWDLRGQGAFRKLDGHRGPVNSVCFSPDGATLAAGGDETVRLWNALTGKSIRILSERMPRDRRYYRREALTIHNDPIRIVAFSPDGKVLLCGGLNNTILAWDTSSLRYRIIRVGG